MIKPPVLMPDLLFEKPGFALVNPMGKAVHYADRSAECLAAFVKMREGSMVTQEHKTEWAVTLREAGWQIVRAQLGIFHAKAGPLVDLVRK